MSNNRKIVKKFVIRTNLPQFFANLRFQGHRVDLPLLQTVLIEPFFPVVEKYEPLWWHQERYFLLKIKYKELSDHFLTFFLVFLRKFPINLSKKIKWLKNFILHEVAPLILTSQRGVTRAIHTHNQYHPITRR